MAPIGICRMLDVMGILTPGGKTHWRESTILSILSNEKYKGDALLQKTFTVDFLTKKHKQNEGEVPQYYVRGNHEAIIAPDEFEQVQAELARRKRSGRTFSGNSVFASRLICGDCGGYYGQKVWHSNDQPVPEGHLALQPQIWEGPALLNSHLVRGCDQDAVH